MLNSGPTRSVSFSMYRQNNFWRLIAIWPSFHLKGPFSNSRKDNYFPNLVLPRAGCSVPNRFLLSVLFEEYQLDVKKKKMENWKLRGALGPVGREIKENCPFSPTHPPPQDPSCQIYIFVEKCFVFNGDRSQLLFNQWFCCETLNGDIISWNFIFHSKSILSNPLDFLLALTLSNSIGSYHEVEWIYSFI